MKKIIVLMCVVFIFSYADNLKDYFDLYAQYPEVLGEKGSVLQNEIEILLNAKEIQQCQNMVFQRLVKKGWEEKKAKNAAAVGILSEDPYWILVRDAVKFPSGSYGTFNRLILLSSLSGNAGVAILPILPDGKIAFLVHYRHATRSWQIEIPRGIRDKDEDNIQAAKRELVEEIGAVAKKMRYLGVLQPDTGVFSSKVAVYAAFVDTFVPTNREVSESIEKVVFFSLDEIEKALIDGFIFVDLNNRKTKIELHDGFMTFALLQAKLRKLI